MDARDRRPARDFRDLKVWRSSHELVLKVYRMTRRFPPEERFGLTSQMRRAAVSAPANIAEGFKKRTKRDKANFYNIAQGSLEELKYYMILSQDLEYVKNTSALMERRCRRRDAAPARGIRFGRESANMNRIRKEQGNGSTRYVLPTQTGRGRRLFGVLFVGIVTALVFVIAYSMYSGVEPVEISVFLILVFPGIFALLLFLFRTTSNTVIEPGPEGFLVRALLFGRALTRAFIPFAQIASIQSRKLPWLYSKKYLELEGYVEVLKCRGQFKDFLDNVPVKPRFLDCIPIDPGKFSSLAPGYGVVVTTKQGVNLVLCNYLTQEETAQLAQELDGHIAR